MQGAWPLEPALLHEQPALPSSSSSRLTRADLPIPQLDDQTEQVRWKYMMNDQVWMLVPDESNDSVKSVLCDDNTWNRGAN
jgi:hypothetical protein